MWVNIRRHQHSSHPSTILAPLRLPVPLHHTCGLFLAHPRLREVCPPPELPAALWLTAQRLRDLHFAVIYQLYHSPKALGV